MAITGVACCQIGLTSTAPTFFLPAKEVPDERLISRFNPECSGGLDCGRVSGAGARTSQAGQARKRGRRHARRTASRTCRACGRTPPLLPSNGRASWPAKRFLPKKKRPTWKRERRRMPSIVLREKATRGTYNQFWFDRGTKVVGTRRTSLVVDPPDGRVPLRPEAEAKRDYDLEHSADSYEHMSVWDRCITRGVPGGMFPAGYNNAYQIVQIPGYVVILYEMIHEARMIPLDGRPHPPAGVGLWNGDSVGRWEGNTLVVDTTNFNGKGWIATSAAAGRVKGIPQSTALHVVERFTRVDADTIDYEVTIDDPNVYTRPWKVAIPLNRDPIVRDLRVRLPRGKHGGGEHPRRWPCSRQGRRKKRRS